MLGKLLIWGVGQFSNFEKVKFKNVGEVANLGSGTIFKF